MYLQSPLFLPYHQGVRAITRHGWLTDKEALADILIPKAESKPGQQPRSFWTNKVTDQAKTCLRARDGRNHGRSLLHTTKRLRTSANERASRSAIISQINGNHQQWWRWSKSRLGQGDQVSMIRGRVGVHGGGRREEGGMLSQEGEIWFQQRRMRQFLPEPSRGSTPGAHCGYFWGFVALSDNFMGILRKTQKTLFTALPLTLLYSWKSAVQSPVELLTNIMFSYLCSPNNTCF